MRKKAKEFKNYTKTNSFSQGFEPELNRKQKTGKNISSVGTKTETKPK